MIERGEDPRIYEWSVPTLPKFSAIKGPLDFIEKLWKSEARELPATLAVCPSDKLIDIGPYVVDLYRYLKTELWENWEERSRAPDNFKDKYFCYATDSLYKPREHHFSHFVRNDNLSPESIAKDL